MGPSCGFSLTDVGSTSGWLIPQAEFKRRRLDPKEVFQYSEGASHAAQAIALLDNQTDLVSDYDRNLDVLADTGRIGPVEVEDHLAVRPSAERPDRGTGRLPR